MSLIRGVQSFDTDNNRWPNTKEQIYKDAPTLRVEDMKKLVSCELYDMHMKFIFSMKDLNVDEPVMMLLLLIVLFTSDRPGLQETARIQARQDHYLQLIRYRLHQLALSIGVGVARKVMRNFVSRLELIVIFPLYFLWS